MSKFTSAKRINTRWRGNDFVGAPGSSHTFPNELHDEFLVDWAYPIQIGDITITETPTTGNIQVSTLTVGDIVLTGTATGNFGTGSTVVQGTAPISISTTSNTSTVSLNANYQTAGTYVTAVSGTAPIVASTDTAGIASVSLNASYSTSTHDHTGVYQAAGTYVTAVNGTAPITASTTTAGIVTVGLSASYASSAHAHATSDVTSGNFVATLAAGTGVTVTGADANAAAKTVAIGQAVATNSNVTFNQITASDYIKLSSWNQATDGNDASADTVTVTTAGTYYAIGAANCEVSFTPDFVGQQFFVTMTGYCSLNTTTVQYAFVRVTLTDSSNTLVDTLGYGRSDNPGASGRGGTVAFNQIWTADTTSARKIKLYGTTQTTNGLVLSLSYWQINVMALA